MKKIIEEDAAGLVCIMLDIHIWSGRQRLTKDDLIRANPALRALPETDLANLGSVKICDPDDVKKFQKIKGRAERVLKRAGLPMLGAVGVPSALFESEVFPALIALQREFEQLEKTFIDGYDKAVDAWKLKHTMNNPAWKHLFTAIPSAKHVAGRLGFDFHPYRVAAPAEEFSSELNERFNEQMGGLKGDLLREVAAEANMMMANYLVAEDPSTGTVGRRSYITPKTLGPLKRVAEKLRNFQFLDPTIGPLAEHIFETLAGIPTIGRIDGVNLMKVWSLSRILASPEQAANVAAIAVPSDMPDEVVAPVTVAAKAQTMVEAESVDGDGDGDDDGAEEWSEFSTPRIGPIGPVSPPSAGDNLAGYL